MRRSRVDMANIRVRIEFIEFDYTIPLLTSFQVHGFPSSPVKPWPSATAYMRNSAPSSSLSQET